MFQSCDSKFTQSANYFVKVLRTIVECGTYRVVDVVDGCQQHSFFDRIEQQNSAMS